MSTIEYVFLDEGEPGDEAVVVGPYTSEDEALRAGQNRQVIRLWTPEDWAEASSAAETENDTYCEIVFDGTDTNGDVWNRCTVHNRLVFGDAPVCEGYRPAPYVESAEVRKTRLDIETGGNYA